MFAGPDRRGDRLGLHPESCLVALASAHLALADGRRPGAEARQGPAGPCPAGRGDAPGQRRAARGQCPAAVPGVAGNDGQPVAQRLRGGRLRGASAARRIGGLDHRAEGRAQRAVRPVGDWGLRLVRPRPERGSLPVGGRRLDPGADGQTDVGDLAVAVPVVGLLAAREAAGRGEGAGFAVTLPLASLRFAAAGKSAPVVAGCGVRRSHVPGPAVRWFGHLPGIRADIRNGLPVRRCSMWPISARPSGR